MARPKRLKLEWHGVAHSERAEGPDGILFQIDSEAAHPGTMWWADIMFPGDPGFRNSIHKSGPNSGHRSPNYDNHQRYAEIENLLWPPNGHHNMTKEAAKRVAEVFSYMVETGEVVVNV